MELGSVFFIVSWVSALPFAPGDLRRGDDGPGLIALFALRLHIPGLIDMQRLCF